MEPDNKELMHTSPVQCVVSLRSRVNRCPIVYSYQTNNFFSTARFTPGLKVNESHVYDRLGAERSWEARCLRCPTESRERPEFAACSLQTHVLHGNKAYLKKLSA